MSEHTPTPWAVFGDDDTVAIVNPRGRAPKNEIVFWSGFDASHYPKQVKANAALIVEAVNNHEALKAENERLRSELEQAKGQVKKAQATFDEIAGQRREIERFVALVERQNICLQDCDDVLGEAISGSIPGSKYDLEWDGRRDRMRTEIAALTSTERNDG